MNITTILRKLEPEMYWVLAVIVFLAVGSGVIGMATGGAL